MLACLIYFPHLRDCCPLLLIVLRVISDVLSSVLVLYGRRAKMSSNYSALTKSMVSLLVFNCKEEEGRILCVCV